MDYCVNALSGLYLIVTDSSLWRVICNHTVSMPSRAYTSLLHIRKGKDNNALIKCQCPLGLIPHCYHIRMISVSLMLLISVNALSGLYLIVT